MEGDVDLSVLRVDGIKNDALGDWAVRNDKGLTVAELDSNFRMIEF